MWQAQPALALAAPSHGAHRVPALALAAPSHGAHRVPAPPSSLHGRLLVAAVAAGALFAASQTLDTDIADASGGTATLPQPRLAADTPTLAADTAWFSPEVLPAPSAVGESDVQALSKAAKLAASAASAASAATEQAEPQPGTAYPAGEDHGLDGWVAQALSLLGLPQVLASGVKAIIMHESGGRPDAINLSDSNARAGHPSQGLMQLVPSTYRAYVLPSLADRPITDPVANITAGLRYMIANYGLATVAAGGRYSGHGVYLGY